MAVRFAFGATAPEWDEPGTDAVDWPTSPARTTARDGCPPVATIYEETSTPEGRRRVTSVVPPIRSRNRIQAPLGGVAISRWATAGDGTADPWPPAVKRDSLRPVERQAFDAAFLPPPMLGGEDVDDDDAVGCLSEERYDAARAGLPTWQWALMVVLVATLCFTLLGVWSTLGARLEAAVPR